MRSNRKLLLGFSSFTVLALLFAFNNCSSQGRNGVDKALSATNSSTGTPTPDPTPTPTPSPSPSPTPASTGGVSEIPAGAIMPMATSSCPVGWLAADGSMPLRSVYTNLFNAIGTIYGPGDGSTTFTLPDYRGYFLRGFSGGSGNDPEASTRTARGDGTGGDVVGSKQADQLKSHKHFIPQGQMYGSNAGGGDTVGGASRVGQGWTDDAGGFETRPKNISVLYCISTGGQ